MSGKFDIEDNFNVYDEWGNYVGKFTPTGSSSENAFLMLIAMIFLWTMGFIIYALFRLISKGFQEAKKGNWGKTIAYWALPGILVGAMCISVLTTTVASAIQQHQYNVEDQRAKIEAENLVSNPPITVEMWKTKCTGSHSDCPWGDGAANNPTYIFIKITNDWSGDVLVSWGEPNLYCNISGGRLSSGETKEFHCVSVGVDFDTIPKYCISISYEISSYSPMYKYHPRATICHNI